MSHETRLANEGSSDDSVDIGSVEKKSRNDKRNHRKSKEFRLANSENSSLYSLKFLVITKVDG
jgi:hypothetical protein